jgi:hypothetical protein
VEAGLGRLVEAWTAARRDDALGRLVLALADGIGRARASGAPPSVGVPILVRLARRAPTFALRRRAYEALEHLDAVASLEPASYLADQLRRNGTDSCRIRRWYVARLAALRDPSTRRVLVAERERRGGFLNLERVGACLDDVVNPALAAMER